MKNVRFTAFLLLLMCMAVGVQAQDSKVKKANELYDQYAFPEAAEAYKKVLAKTDVPEAKIKLAECYRLMNMPVEAEYWYEQVVDLAEAEPLHRYHYGMALKANGKFDDAKQAFMEYAQSVPADTRGLRQVEACEQSTYFQTDPGIYNITITNINTGVADFGPAFYKDGIVFASEDDVKYADKEYNWREKNFLDLFYAEVEEGDNPAQLKKKENFKGKVNTWLHEGTVTFTEDFETMYFTRNSFYKGKIGYDKEGLVGYNMREDLKTVKLQIFEGKADGDKFGDIVSLPFNSDEYNVGHPTLSSDGQALYFISDMPGGYGETDVYVSYKSGDSWGQPENLGPEINTEGREMFPFISADGTLYFSSDALPGLGGLDLFSSQLMDDGTWSAPENLRDPINTNADDFAFIIDKENKKGYFSSNRPGGAGDDDIYSFTKLTNILKGVVVDCNTEEPIEGSLVKLIVDGQVMQKKKTLANGLFTFPISAGREYDIVASKLGFEEGSQELYTESVGQIEVKIPICPIDEDGITCLVKGRVYEKGSDTNVSGALVTLTDVNTGEDQQYVTGEDGLYLFELAPESNFTLHATKELFFTETKTVSTVGIDCTDSQRRDLGLDIALTRMPESTDVDDTRVNFDNPITIVDDGRMNDLGFVLNHIYYDFDESFIRDDARPELDKLVRFMNDNPSLIVELRSHTDSRGSSAYNEALSDRRAQSARDFILARGIDQSRLTAVGYGETQLTNECSDGVRCSDSKHQDNRRTEFVITGAFLGAGKYSLPRYYYDSDQRKGKNFYKTGSGSGITGSIGIGDSFTSDGSKSRSGGVSGSSSSYTSGSSYYGSGVSSGTSYPGAYSTGNGSSGGIGISDSYTAPGTYNSGSTNSTSGGTYGISSSYSNSPTYYDPNAGKADDCCVTPMNSSGGSSSDVNYTPGASAEGIQYKIQIGASPAVDMAEYNALKDLGLISTEPSTTGMDRILLGPFPNQSSADNILYQIQQRGYDDAFVVKYENGLRTGH